MTTGSIRPANWSQMTHEQKREWRFQNWIASADNINFVNTNALVRGGNWVIGLSKTGFINEAGRCLVMQAEISGQPTIIVLLDSAGKMTRIGDANRIRKWVERNDGDSLGDHVHG